MIGEKKCTRLHAVIIREITSMMYITIINFLFFIFFFDVCSLFCEVQLLACKSINRIDTVRKKDNQSNRKRF